MDDLVMFIPMDGLSMPVYKHKNSLPSSDTEWCLNPLKNWKVGRLTYRIFSINGTSSAFYKSIPYHIGSDGCYTSKCYF